MRAPKAVVIVRRFAMLAIYAIRWGLPMLAAAAAAKDERAARTGELLRRFLESMGVGYVKLGQFLATRFDLFPKAVCDELSKLFDAAPAIPYESVAGVIEQELGAPVDHALESIDRDPIAAASLAQVHVARARDGQRLALKVQRPGIDVIFEADMAIAGIGAKIVDAFRLLGVTSAVELLEEFIDFTRLELDFETEGRVAARLRGSGAGDVYVPAIRWDLTTKRLLALEYIEGVSLNVIIDLVKNGKKDDLARRLPGIRLEDVVRKLTHGVLHQVAVTGLFHADPHPGNILVRPDGTVALIDFGIFGHLTPMQRLLCADYMRNVAVGDFEASFHSYYRLMSPTPTSDKAGFRRATLKMNYRWREANKAKAVIKERHFGALMLRTLGMLRQYRVRLDTNLLLFWRVLYMLDSVGLSMHRDIDMIGIVQSYFAKHPPSFSGMLGNPIWNAPAVSPDPASLVAPLYRRGRGLGADRLLRSTSSIVPQDQRTATKQAFLIAFATVSLALALLIVSTL